MKIFTVEFKNESLVMFEGQQWHTRLAFKSPEVSVYINRSRLPEGVTWYAVSQFVINELSRLGFSVAQLYDKSIPARLPKKRKKGDPRNFTERLI
jgi:hypothetical protein